MNYLAHIFLSGKERHVQIGNFVGDAVKGNAYRDYKTGFRTGILLHREIDAFSDAHPLVREAVRLGRPVLGRYAAVVTDIFFDHFLAVHFQRYSAVSLRSFTYGFYGALMWNYTHLPPRFQGFMWHFILTDRLGRYASLRGIEESLQIMVKYRGLQVDPQGAIRFLTEHYEELEECFEHFFPELQTKCQCELVRLTTNMLNS